MPFPFAAVGIGLSALGLISNFLGSKKASSAAKKEAKEGARLEGMVTAEKIRQLHVEEKVMRGETIAAYAGSGVKVGTGSPLDILAEQRKEFAFQRDITSRVGATKAAQGLTRGQNIASAYRYQGYSNMASGLGDIFSFLGTRTKSAPPASGGGGGH